MTRPCHSSPSTRALVRWASILSAGWSSSASDWGWTASGRFHNVLHSAVCLSSFLCFFSTPRNVPIVTNREYAIERQKGIIRFGMPAGQRKFHERVQTMATFDARVALERTPPPSCSSSTPPYQPYESRIRNWRQ